MALNVDKLILSFFAIIVGVALIPIIQGFVTDANVTGSTATLVSLIPLFFAIGIVISTVRGMVGGGR